MKKLFILLFCIIALYTTFTNPLQIYAALYDSMYIWLSKIFPSIFVFYTISNIIINYNILDYLLKPFNFLTPFIKLSKKGKELFLISILIGLPSSSALIKGEFEAQKISANETKNLLKICGFINPLFIVSFLNSKCSYLIIASQIITSIIISLFFKKEDTQQSNTKKDKKSIFEILGNAIEISIYVLSIQLFFSIIIFIFNTYIPKSLMSLSFLEISNGLTIITSLMSISFYKYLLINMLVSFGSISIIYQVKGIINNNSFFFPFVLFRLLSAVISSIVFSILYFIII